MIGLLVLGLLAAAADDGAGREDAADQSVRLTLRGDAIEVEYAVQLGRQAAFAEVLQIDTDRDGRLSPEEQARYFARLEETIRSGLELEVDGRRAALRRVGEPRLEMPFRKVYRFEAERAGGRRVEIHNENLSDLPGASSISIEPGRDLDVLLETDPAGSRDLVFEVRQGEGRVERRAPERPKLPGPSGAETGIGLLARILCAVGLGGAGALLWRGRTAAALAALLGAAGWGVAALSAGVPPAGEAERIFLALHGGDSSARRVKPLETRIERAMGVWSPEFRVHYRWAAYGALAHSGHTHARAVEEKEARYRVLWQNGAWTLTEVEAPRS